MANQKAEIVISARDETKIAFASVKNNLSGIGGIAGGLNNTLGALAPLLGAASFTSFLKKGIDTLDMLGDLSDRTGVAASTLAGFQLVADQSDTSLEALGKGINKLSVYMAENGDEARKLGLSAKDPAEAFIQLSDVLSNISDPQQRAATANKVLGKSYQELLPALLQGSDALRKQIAAGQAYANITPKMVQQAQEFNDQMDALKTQVGYASVSFAGQLLPSMTDTTKEMIRMQQEGNTLLALFRGLAGLGKLPFDFFIDSKFVVDSQSKIKELEADISRFKANLKSVENGGLIDRALFGSKDELKQKLIIAQNQLEAFKKFGAELDKKTAPAAKGKTGDTGTNPITNTGGTSKRDADAEAARRFVEGLQKEVETLGLSKTALLEYEAAHLKLNSTQKEAVAGLIEQLGAQEKLNQAKADEAAAEEERRQIIADTVRSQMQFNAEAERVKDMVDPTREYSREIEKLNEFYKAGRISAEEFAKAKALAQDGMSSYVKSNKDEFEDLKNAIHGFSRDATNDLVDFAFGAGTSFEQMANDFAKAIAKMLVQKQLMEPLFNAISGSMSSGGGGLLGSIFGSGSADVAPSASYGGILGMEGGSSGGGFVDWLKNLVPSFDVGSDYVPHDMLAMIHKGEKIVPAAQNNGSSNGFGNVSMNFVLNSPADARTQQQIAANAFAGLRRAAMRNS